MTSNQRQSESESRAFRHLLFLVILLAIGFVISRSLRFTIPLLNYVFGVAVLCIPFVAVRPLRHLPRVPRLFGFILVSPLMLVSLLMIVGLAACNLNPRNKGCLRELNNIQQNGYSVHLVLDDCGGAIGTRMLMVEQHRPMLPGLYLFRSVDLFEDAYEGEVTAINPNQIHLHIPKGVEGSFWTQEIDRTYTLKKYVYF